MVEKVLDLGTHFQVKFKCSDPKFGFIEITREGKYKTNLIVTPQDISEIIENLNWLEGRILLHDKVEYDNPNGFEYRDFHESEDECC